LNKLILSLKISEKKSYNLNPFGLLSENYLNILNISDMFKIPSLKLYNNLVTRLLLNKQIEFKYVLYKKLLIDILLSKKSIYKFSIKRLVDLYSNLETKYLTDIYRILSF